MLSSPLGPPVGIIGIMNLLPSSSSRSVLSPTTITTPQQVTTTTLQTVTIRIVKVVASGGITISFRTVTVPVTVTTTSNRTATILRPQTLITSGTSAQLQALEYRIPSVGGFRISDNESPIPQCRGFYFLNDFQSPFDAVNARLGGNASIPYATRNTFGFEEAFFNGNASFGLRLPINSMKVDSSLPGAGGEDTAIGDLFLISKVLFYRTEAGSAVSGGLAVTLPTGRRSFAGVDQGDVGLDHHVNLQPYIGYLWRPTERLYVQGFSSVDIPMNASDVTLMYNDIGVGYFAYLGQGVVTAVAPTVECRVTTPLNHNGINGSGVYSDAQGVQILGGATIELCRRATLTVGAGAPLTGPKPYDWQFLTQLNFRF
jgi:hypothetical protein